MPELDETPTLPILVFDGDCGFCTASARWGQERLGLRSVHPWQSINLDQYGLSEQGCRAAVQWVGADGTIRSGHLAVAAALGEGNRWQRLLGRVLESPGFSSLGGLIYRVIAKNRYRLPGASDACRM